MADSRAFEYVHRERKRKAEIKIVLRHMKPFLSDMPNRRVLEFGSGEGWQIPHLRKLGRLTVCDIYKSENISKNYPDIDFTICDIKKTPFPSGNFDIIFSNHVLEHIEETKAAFEELKRIGRGECVYVFIVPTAMWLLLSLPAQCFNALRRALKREAGSKIEKREREGRGDRSGLRRFLPAGHGWQKNFFHCFNAFRAKAWDRLFSDGGFEVVKRIPLLLYAPSEFPVVPTSEFLVHRGICSSLMFVLKKKT